MVGWLNNVCRRSFCTTSSPLTVQDEVGAIIKSQESTRLYEDQHTVESGNIYRQTTDSAEIRLGDFVGNLTLST